MLLALAAPIAAADEVVLANGDRIRGEVVALSHGKLVMRTDYAGEIALAWPEVVSLSTAGPVGVLLEGEAAPRRGILQPLYDGGALLVGDEVLELSLAQIAFLNPRPWESGVGAAYSGRLTLSGAYSRGNTRDERVNGEAELDARAREYRYALSGRLERRDEPVSGISSAWRAGANYDRFVQVRRFFYGRASLEHDRAKDLRSRAAAGAGYGAQLVDTPRATLSLRAGPEYVVVDRYVGANERYPALGWGVKAAYEPYFHENEGFWDLEDADKLVVRSKTGLRLPLLAGLGARAQLNIDWESRPAPGRRSTDATLLLGVDYAW